MKVVRTTFIMLSLSYYHRQLCRFTNPLQGPHGIVKCPSKAHFKILLEVVGLPGTFTVNLDTLLLPHTVFHLRYRRKYADCTW